MSHMLTMPLCAGGDGTKRKAWDLKGKVSDMEGKIRNYQTKVKSVNQENETLKGTMAQSQMRVTEMERELERQRRQIRCHDSSVWKNYQAFYCNYCNVSVCVLLNVFSFPSENEKELQALSGVRDELERVSSDKSALQKELSNLEGKYKVMETLRDSQETELQTLKV